MSKNAIPNFFTFCNLGCGILSLLMTFQSNFKWACGFILLAGFFDRYDGVVARLLQVSSDIGKELDSLSDLVSFGVAPSILTYFLHDFSSMGILGYALVLLFPMAGAYRLARFNTTSFNKVFVGVPITIAGMLLALFSLVTMKYTINPLLTITLLISLSYLMVSNLKITKI